MIKGILFDLDGVLFDSEAFDTKILYDYLDYINSPLPRERLHYLICPNTETDIYGNMLEGYVAKEDQDEFLKNMRAYYDPRKDKKNFAELMFKEVPDTLKWLKDNGFKIACASSSFYDYVVNALTQSKIIDYFDIFVSGRDFTRNKPAPDCYLYCAEKLQLKPEECLVVEDSPNGIASGKNANMKVFVRNEYTIGLDQRGGDYYGDDFSKLIEVINELNTK